MIRFYAPDIESVCTLPEEESVHCSRVLRLRQGDLIEVVDGKGHVYSCEILNAHPKHTDLKIISKNAQQLHWSPTITLAVAPTKNMDRMEWLVEKAVEIGVNKLVFINCHNSVRRVVKGERIRKIIVSAMKQSLKAAIPEFVELIDIKDFLTQKDSSIKFVGYCDSETERQDFSTVYNGCSDITIMIGPEGDFTEEEIKTAIDVGYLPVTFGNTRLRTETAALFSLCAAHTLMLRADKE